MALGLEQSFRSLLEKARQRSGLSVVRISDFIKGTSSTKAPTQAILEHPFFVAMAGSMNVDEIEFFVRYVDVCIDELPANRSDPLRWVLNIGDASGLPVRKELGERRKAAAAMVSSSRNEQIGVSTFLNSIEPIFLKQLCEFLDNPHTARILKFAVQPDEVASFLGAAPRTELRARAVVMGGAVMDINFLIQDLPQPGASVQANRFLMHPGGKALTQAVACARLGLKTHLIATIGDDPNGQAILAYLEDEGVDTSLVRVMENELTAVTGVISTRRRDSFAIGWKNDTRLPLSPQHTTEPDVAKAIEDCDFFLCSFEAPTDTVEEALSLAHSSGATTIVTPAPPYDLVILDQKHHGFIDFLVCNVWELSKFGHFSEADFESPEDSPEAVFERTAQELLTNGHLGNLVVTHNKDCHVFFRPSEGPARTPIDKLVVRSAKITLTETVGERDAFCAMLAKKHAEYAADKISFLDLVNWATASMSSLTHQLGVPLTMPELSAVEASYDQICNSQPLGRIDPSKNGEA